MVCQDCPAGQMPLFPLGSSEASDPKPDKSYVVHESPCATDPCSMNAEVYPESKAVYRAFTLSDQQWYWRNLPGLSDVVYSDENKYLANWRICQQCPSGLRPAVPPSAWININGSGNPEIKPDGMFYYETTCVAGPACSACKLASVGALLPDSTTTTPSPETTTPRPTTTRPPCGCDPPKYCPTVVGECVRTECVPGGAGVAGKPVCPSTTTGPNQCFDGRKVCVCGSTTTTTTTTTTRFPVTTTPIGGCGNCNWLSARDALSGSLGWLKTSNCVCGVCSYPATGPTLCGQTTSSPCAISTITTTTTTACPATSCTGACIYYSVASWSGVSGAPVTFAWRFSPSSTCKWTCGAGTWGCGCPCPPGQPSSACDIVETSCGNATRGSSIGGPYPDCNGVPPYVECACCTTQACDKFCTFKGNGTGGWTKIDDPCPTTCPCPAYPPSNSQSDCDMRRYKCGSVTPTTTSTSPPSTTTTTPAPGACCLSGACNTLSYTACINAGGAWQGAGVSCVGVTCTTTTTTTEGPGACCVGGQQTGPGTNCISAFRSYCQQVSGNFIPGGSCIGANPCMPTTTASPTRGRCCWGDGFCANDTLQDWCTAAGQAFSPTPYSWVAGATCASSPCSATTTTTTTTTTTITTTTTTATPTGACCVAGSCSIQTQANCLSAGGTWNGAGTNCIGVMCPEV